MNKKLSAALMTFFIFVAPAFSADNFMKRLNICNPYKTSYVANDGQSYIKSVMGAHLEIETGLRSCIFYIQEAQNSYKLCNMPMSSLNKKDLDLSDAKCLMTDENGLKKMKQDLAAGTYYMQRAIINKMH